MSEEEKKKKTERKSSQFSHCIFCGEFILSAVHTCYQEPDYHDFDDHDQDCDYDDDYFEDEDEWDFDDQEGCR